MLRLATVETHYKTAPPGALELLSIMPGVSSGRVATRLGMTIRQQRASNRQSSRHYQTPTHTHTWCRAVSLHPSCLWGMCRTALHSRRCQTKASAHQPLEKLRREQWTFLEAPWHTTQVLKIEVLFSGIAAKIFSSAVVCCWEGFSGSESARLEHKGRDALDKS